MTSVAVEKKGLFSIAKRMASDLGPVKYDIIVVGVISLDTTLEIPFLPGENSEGFVQQIRDAHGGAAANVAAYASFYGGLKVSLVGRIGNDQVGNELIDRLRVYRVDTRGVGTSTAHKSTRIITALLPNGSRTYFVHLGAHQELTVEDVPSELLDNTEIIYIAPCSPEIHSQFVKALSGSQKTICLNPGSVYFEQGAREDLFNLIGECKFLFLNAHEALRYSQKSKIEEAGAFFLHLGARHVVVTTSAPGSFIFGPTVSEPQYFRGLTTESVNPIGAGDAYAAGFLSEYLRSGDLAKAAVRGNIFGAFAVTRQDPRHPNPSLREFEDFIRDHKKHGQ